MKHLAFIFFYFVFSLPIAFSSDSDTSPEYEQYLKQMSSEWDAVSRQRGKIQLSDGLATLDVPKGFYYLNPSDSETVLVDIWGNFPGAGTESLGMLIPAKFSPFDEDSWAVTIEYVEEGYISDEDADEINYDDLLEQMQDEAREESELRIEQGYESIELIGWAAEPYYDKDAHKLYWAKEVKFGEQEINTLNYNIRVLGRKGVLVLNFIAGMDQKSTIDSKLDTVLALAEFDDGARYDDFNPEIDEVAAYGLGALVAGKMAAKAGLFAAAFLFLKKFGVFILVGIWALFSKVFNRKRS